MPSTEDEYVLFDAGLFIGALLTGDPRHAEARLLVESARRGDMLTCTTTGILSEVYAALTWHQAQPPHDPEQAAALVAGITSVFTYDAEDWESFEGEGLSIAGPATTMARLGRS